MNHIQKLIDQYDSSFFHYDLDAFESHLKSIQQTLHPDIKIFYACKANPLSKILSVLEENGFGVDVASMGELQQAKNAGVSRIISTGPSKPFHYLNRLLGSGVTTIICESLNQLKDLNDVAQEHRIKPEVLLRVQLDWEDSLKSVLGGSSITPFGIGVEDWKKVNLSEYTHLNIVGIHCFQWGNMLDLQQLSGIWESTIDQCVTFAREMKLELKVLDLGGGLGISYQDERELSFPAVHELLLGFKHKYDLKEIWLELGRYSIGKFGSYFTKITDIKTVRGKHLIVTEGGINHIARPTLVNESFPCNAISLPAVNLQKFTIHGPLCTALDSLGEHDLPKDLKVGDWLEFKKTGAYGFTESMPFFLCHHLAGEAFSYRGITQMIRVPKPADWMV